MPDPNPEPNAAPESRPPQGQGLTTVAEQRQWRRQPGAHDWEAEMWQETGLCVSQAARRRHMLHCLIGLNLQDKDSIMGQDSLFTTFSPSTGLLLGTGQHWRLALIPGGVEATPEEGIWPKYHGLHSRSDRQCKGPVAFWEIKGSQERKRTKQEEMWFK